MNAVSINEIDGVIDDHVSADQNYLLLICSNFIVVDMNQNVRFAHESAREYLIRRETNNILKFSYAEAHAQAAETCLAYLSLCNVNIIEKYSFPVYSVQY
jgi:serine/threonine-protein kinase RIO1